MIMQNGDKIWQGGMKQSNDGVKWQHKTTLGDCRSNDSVRWQCVAAGEMVVQKNLFIEVGHPMIATSDMRFLPTI